MSVYWLKTSHFLVTGAQWSIINNNIKKDAQIHIKYHVSFEYHIDNSERLLMCFAILLNYQYLLFYVHFGWHKEFFVAPLWPTYILHKGIFWTPIKLPHVTVRGLSDRAIRLPSMFDLKLYKLSVILFCCVWLGIMKVKILRQQLLLLLCSGGTMTSLRHKYLRRDEDRGTTELLCRVDE